MLDVLEIWDRVTHENTEAGKDFKAISKRVSKLRRELENDTRRTD
jgi:hypothetical protein